MKEPAEADRADACAAGVAALRAGDLPRAEACFRRILQTEPDHADARHLLGAVAIQDGKPALAVDLIIDAIGRNALVPEFYYNLGYAYQLLGRDDLAVENYRHALRLHPGFSSAWNNLGNVLRQRGDVDEAVEAYRRNVALRPDEARRWCLLGRAVRDQGTPEAALEAFRTARAHEPDSTAALSGVLFALQYVPAVPADELAREHRAFDELCRPWQEAAARFEARQHERIRVGFVSPDLGYHPVGLFLEPVLRALDAARFETFGYSHRTKVDDQTRRIADACDNFHDVSRLDDDALAARIRTDEVDVLFDLAGHTDDNRLPVFARKPAPRQVTWLGYTGTTGLSAMDGLLADRFHVPEGAEPLYAERVLRMPHGYVCYQPPAYAPKAGPLPARDRGHVTFGCFNNPAKLNDAVLKVWSRILSAVPDARLVLKYKGCDQPTFRRRVAAVFEPAGIDAGRVEFLGNTTHVVHLQRLERTDVALDPFPYSGGISTLEAVWMGVPVVTCPGGTFAGRHALSHLTNCGAAETVTPDFDEYVRCAVELAGDRERLAEMRAQLRPRMADSPACDVAGFARDLGELLEDLVRGA